MLEKERRENDKAAEAKKEQTSTPVQPAQPAYRAAAPVRTAAPPKSRKGLYIVLGAILGVVLLIIVASISSTNETSTTAGTEDFTTAASTERSITEAEKAELITAIKLGESALLNARYTLNNQSINKYFTGEALRTVQADFETVRASGFSLYSTVENQHFSDYTINADGTQASVHFEETSNDMLVTPSTNTCYQKRPPYAVSYTVFLVRSESGWLISSFTGGNNVLPDWGPCE